MHATATLARTRRKACRRDTMVLLPVHITAGLLALSAGAVALWAAKGATLHRRSGMVFVVAMLVMGSTGAIIASLKPDRGTALAGVLVFYVVCTGLLTIKRPVEQSRRPLPRLMGRARGRRASEYMRGGAARHAADSRLDGYPSAFYFV